LVAKESPSGYSQFRQEVEGQRFRNHETGNDVKFVSLPRREQARIYAEWRRKQRGDEPRKEKERGLVPIDKKKARAEAKRLADRVSDWKVRDPEEEIGKRFLPGMGREIQMGKMFFESVSGRPRPLKIVLNHKPSQGLWTAGRHFVTGGMVNFVHTGRNDKSAYPTELIINLDSSRRYEQFTDPKNRDRIEREIYSVLIHEMTHARDLVESLNARERHKEKSEKGGVSEYHNRPSEVRAFKRQVADEIWSALERMHEDEDEPDWIGAGSENVMELLSNSTTWHRVRHFLTPENRKEFLKTMASVVRKFKENRGGKVARRVAAAWLSSRIS